jgi:hypothetical protein
LHPALRGAQGVGLEAAVSVQMTNAVVEYFLSADYDESCNDTLSRNGFGFRESGALLSGMESRSRMPRFLPATYIVSLHRLP